MVYRMDLSAAGRTGTSWERVLVWSRNAFEEKVERLALRRIMSMKALASAMLLEVSPVILMELDCIVF
jgi:hypothetical protein